MVEKVVAVLNDNSTPVRENVYKRCKLEKKEVVINGRTFDAYFPSNHLNLDGLVYNVSTREFFEGTTCYVLRKNEKEWNLLYQGATSKFSLDGDNVHLDCQKYGVGVYQLLDMIEDYDLVDESIIIEQEAQKRREIIAGMVQRAEQLDW